VRGLPKGWVSTTLGSTLVHVIGGGTPSRKVSAYFDGSIPWFTVKDMKVLKPCDAKEHITTAAIADSTTNLIPAGTLTVATRIALGRAIRPTVPYAINQDLKALILGRGTNQDFLLYWIGSNERLIQDLGSGTTVSGIRLETLHRLPLNLPPSSEQTRIVAKLEELLSDLDAGVAELKAAQAKLTQYRQSLLKAAVEGALTAEWRTKHKPTESGAELLARILTERRARWEAKQLAKFKEQGKAPPQDWQKKYPEPVKPDTNNLRALPEGWVWASVDQLAEIGTGVTPLRSNSQFYSNGRIPWVTSGALNCETVTEASEHVTSLALTECRLDLYPAGTLLVAMYGEGKTRGKCSELAIPATINQAIAALALDGSASTCKPYLKLFLLKSYNDMRKHASGGVQPNLNLQIIRSIAVPLPSPREQATITDYVATQLTGISHQSLTIDHSLKQSAAQHQNILRAAFAGELVPQDPNDEPASVLLARIRAERHAQSHKKSTKSRIAKTEEQDA
jgi:type I restriction enzyme, S subunit